VVPTALAVDPRNRLLVADAGADQQIKIYDAIDTAPQLKDSFGTKGGIFARPIPGKFGDLRFNRPTAIGVDGQGNVYVASSGSTAGGSTVLECYSPHDQCRWQRLGLEFIDLADFDPAAERDVFTKEEHFTMSWGQARRGGVVLPGLHGQPVQVPRPALYTESPRAPLCVRELRSNGVSRVPYSFGELQMQFGPVLPSEMLFERSRKGHTK
jgi:hypothetical protein